MCSPILKDGERLQLSTYIKVLEDQINYQERGKDPEAAYRFVKRWVGPLKEKLESIKEDG